MRTFAYDAEMRLSSVTQPENGTVSYGYNASGRVDWKTDAKGQRVEYTYDLYGRTTMVKRFVGGVEQVGERTTFEFDTGSGQNLWGRLARIVNGNGVEELFSYTQSGLVAQKKQSVSAFVSPALAVDYAWDGEGRMTSMTYPQTGVPRPGGGYDEVARRVVTVEYDAAGRVSRTLSGGVEVAGNAVWSAAWQMGSYTANGVSHTFAYNERGQMTAQTGYGQNLEYRYSGTANDGRLVSRKDNLSGEEVSYQYDELGRLISAATTGPEWGLSWAYDGFGNRLSQSVTKGTGPVVSLSVNGATNRISSSGFVYDSNGNQTQWSMGGGTLTAAYDVENRMVQVTTSSTTEVYKYNSANQRVVKSNVYGAEMKHFVYGLGGELLGEYGQCAVGGAWYVPCEKQERVYFVGRLVQVEGAGKTVDRLGTVGQTGTRAYPYGEAQTEFATYRRDGASGLDYAWNRYYSSIWGRFTSADPYVMSGGMGNPQGWNRYAYVAGDPVNWHDPGGPASCRVSGWATDSSEMYNTQTIVTVWCTTNSNGLNVPIYLTLSGYYNDGLMSQILSDLERTIDEFDFSEFDRVFSSSKYRLSRNMSILCAEQIGASSIEAAKDQLSRVLVAYSRPGLLRVQTNTAGMVTSVDKGQHLAQYKQTTYYGTTTSPVFEFNSYINWIAPSSTYAKDQRGYTVLYDPVSAMTHQIGASLDGSSLVDLIMLHELSHSFGKGHPDDDAEEFNKEIWKACF